jgi:hypothetical protein
MASDAADEPLVQASIPASLGRGGSKTHGLITTRGIHVSAPADALV